MDKEFNYDELLQITSKEFADYIQERINSQREIRDIMAYRVRVDRHGVTEEEAKECPEDAPIVVVDYLAGWQGVPHSLWSHWFDTNTKRYDNSVINKNMVDRFHSLEGGAEELPELGLYSFSGAVIPKKDMEQHRCEQLQKLQTFNKVKIQYEADWGKLKGGGWTLNLDPGGDSGGGSEWINHCPFCGVHLETVTG